MESLHKDLEADYFTEENFLEFWKGSIVYWVGKHPEQTNLISSLNAAAKMATSGVIDCFYYSLSKEKEELSELICNKYKDSWRRVRVDDTPLLPVEDILDVLKKQLEIGNRRILCVIDDLCLLSTRDEMRTRIEDNIKIIKKLRAFSIENRVMFVCNLYVSKHVKCEIAALNELREVAPVEVFENHFQFFL